MFTHQAEPTAGHARPGDQDSLLYTATGESASGKTGAGFAKSAGSSRQRSNAPTRRRGSPARGQVMPHAPVDRLAKPRELGFLFIGATSVHHARSIRPHFRHPPVAARAKHLLRFEWRSNRPQGVRSGRGRNPTLSPVTVSQPSVFGQRQLFFPPATIGIAVFGGAERRVEDLEFSCCC